MRAPGLAVGGILLAAVLVPALVSIVWTPWPPDRLDIAHRLAAPGLAHPLGTDPFGRDLLSILMVGARNSLLVAAGAIAAGAALGIPAGLLAAEGGGISRALRAVADLLLAFPPLLTVALIAAATRPGIAGSIVAIAAFNLPGFIRVTEAEARSVLARDFVAAAVVSGRSPAAVRIGHVLPNIAPTLLVQVTVATALAVLAEAGLSYLGLGTPPPAPSLGRALAEYGDRVFDHPLLVIAPGVTIAILVLGLNQLGDGLRDALDPRVSRVR